MIQAFIDKHKLPDDFKQSVNEYYQPLGERIFKQFDNASAPFFVGINGCQGSGKSTLSDYIAEYLSCTYSLNVIVMSLDDFYLGTIDRNKLAESIHPMFATRGVPGTHNTLLLNSVITQLKERKSNISIPAFNKATDQPYPEASWKLLDSPADIVILEGWCWGVPAQQVSQLIEPVNTLERQHDSDGLWRNYVNKQLELNYQPLYQVFDHWVALQAPSFDCVYRWRLEQEQKLVLKLQSAGKTTDQYAVMNAAQILNFIQYFQRLTEHGIKTLPAFADTTFFFDQNRQINNHQVKAINSKIHAGNKPQ